MYYDDNLFLVPLWCKECSFDHNDTEINVKIFVELPENVSIDENNNICIFKNYNTNKHYKDIYKKHIVRFCTF